MRRVSFRRGIPCLLAVIVVVAGGLGLPETAWGGSFYVPTLSARADGMAQAYVAQADGLMAAYYNPAGLNRHEGWNLFTNLSTAQVMGLGFKRSPDHLADDYPWVRVNKTLLSGSLAFNYGFKDLGLSIGYVTAAPFAAQLNYGDHFATRHYIKYIMIVFANHFVNVSKRFGEKFEIGAGVGVVSGYVNLQIALNGLQMMFGGPNLEQDLWKIDTKGILDGYQFGGHIGFLWHPCRFLDVGGHYVPKAPLDLKGTMDARWRAVGVGTEVDQTLPLTLPQYASLGVSLKPTPRWRINLEAMWMEWSSIQAYDFQFKEQVSLGSGGQTFTLPGMGLYLPKKWHPNWFARIGAQYTINDRWQARGGYAYDQSAIDPEYVTLEMPDSDRHSFHAGFSWDAAPLVLLESALSYYYFEPLNVKNSQTGYFVEDSWMTAPQNGKREAAYMVLSLSATWRLGQTRKGTAVGG
jgi:long-chain fatty acid transport protein